MFVGRRRELQRLERLMAVAGAGTAATLIVRGPPGVGKTSLINELRRRADVETLVTAGNRGQATLPFVHLHQLLLPLRDQIGWIPGPERQALTRALSMATPAGRSGNRLTVGAAVLSLLTTAAERTPLLLCVDDAQWLDPSSADALGFAIGRLGADRVGVVVAARKGDTSTFDDLDLPVMDLDGLELEAAGSLLGEGFAAGVVEALWAATAGNPLAMLEVGARLSGPERSGEVPLPDLLPLAPTLVDAYRARIETLDDGSRALLVLAAVNEGGDLATLCRAAGQLGISAVVLPQLEAAGLVSVGPDRAVPAHPLVAGVVLGHTPGEQTRAAHRALAAVLRRADEVHRRAWHLAEAAAGPDEDVAAVLDQAADAARSRGAHAVAGESLKRAAGLSVDRSRQRARLVEAGRSFWHGGLARQGLAMLDQALAAADSPVARCEVHLARMEVALSVGKDRAEVYREAEADARQAAPADGALAGLLLAMSCAPAMAAGLLDEASATAALTLELADRHPGIALAAQSVDASLRLMKGDAAAVPTLRVLGGSFVDAELGRGMTGLVTLVALGLIWGEDYDLAGRLLDKLIDRARAAGQPADLPQPLITRSMLASRTRLGGAALADAAEAVSLAGEMGLTHTLAYCQAQLAVIEVGLGRFAEARDHGLESARTLQEIGARGHEAGAHWTLGVVAMIEGKVDAGLTELERARRLAIEAGIGHPAVVPWAPPLVDAYVASGRPGDARRVVDWLEAAAAASGSGWGAAAAARCRAFLAPVEEFEAAFTSALADHGDRYWPLERAVIELNFGQRLRREGRPAAAVTHLLAAETTFEEVGVIGLSLVRAELAACGHRVAETPAGPLAGLTPQEVRVALAVGAGATNREAAQTLILSRRTVEFHLASIYRKLGIRSRSQLVAALAAAGHLDLPARPARGQRWVASRPAPGARAASE